MTAQCMQALTVTGIVHTRMTQIQDSIYSHETPLLPEKL